MIKGNDKKGKRRKGGRRMKGFIIAQKRQERTVMTINLSKGRKTRLRSYSVRHPNFLWTNDQLLQ